MAADIAEGSTAGSLETPAADAVRAGRWLVRIPGAEILRRFPVIPAVGFYLVLHALSAVFFLILLHGHPDWSVGQFLNSWDGKWYQVLAHDGYGGHRYLKEAAHGGDYAWFPFYPGLMRVLSVVPGLTILRAGLLISLAASVAVVWAMFEIGRDLVDERAGFILAGMWALIPASVVETLVYADETFVALALWSLLALRRRQWLTAGALCALAGLTRPTATALIAAVGLVALIEVVKRRGSVRHGGWRPWVAGVLAPLGMGSYVVAVGMHFHRLDGYTWMQRNHWENYVDWGVVTWRSMIDVFMDRPDASPLIVVVTTVVILALPLVLAAQLAQRQPLEWILYTWAVVLLALLTRRFYSTTSRELMPALPFLLAPVAAALRRQPRALVIGGMAFVACLAGWYAWWLPIFQNNPP